MAIRHIVSWALTATDPAVKAEQSARIAASLEALTGVVPGMSSIAVGTDLGMTAGNWDVVLVSEHDDEAALAAYQVHPEHVRAAGFIKSVVSTRSCVDYRL